MVRVKLRVSIELRLGFLLRYGLGESGFELKV